MNMINIVIQVQFISLFFLPFYNISQEHYITFALKNQQKIGKRYFFNGKMHFYIAK